MTEGSDRPPLQTSHRAGVLRAWSILIAMALLWLAAPPAMAQAIESVLAPGKMSEAHAKLEEDCQKCHVKFDRNAQDRLCMDCHKDVREDVNVKRRMHGKMKPQACRTCHTEHKGRGAHIAAFDHASFDHGSTDYMLKGKHQQVDCEKCHVAGKKFREAPHDCVACHKKDDTHKGSLGAKCADCHTETSWKDARFDHSTTHFPLTGKHADVKCADCHKDAHYKDTPLECVACHKKDDKHKGRFGPKCETCHDAKSWKEPTFNHDKDTRYPLVGKHRTVKCETCHTGSLYRDKLPTTCIECHKKDDKHKGSLGDDCARCHTERDWKEPAKFNHDRTDFPLRGKHVNVKCADCHKSQMYKEAPKLCIGCHRKDDKHKGSLGESCQDCHSDRDWKKTSFDHAKTRFPLLGKHQRTECGDCHKTQQYRDTPKDCFSCHQRDDKHEGQEGKQCGQCHNESAWKPAPKFDHGLVSFPLLARHAEVKCKDCHDSVRFKDAKHECIDCHLKDDKHKRTLGTACEQCHNPRSWKTWSFDHDKKTKFPLDGKHKGLACSGCHTQPAQGDKVLASAQCNSCHAKDDVHEGRFGRQCQRCHVTTSFKTLRPGIIGRPVSTLEAPRLRTGAQSLRMALGKSRLPS